MFKLIFYEIIEYSYIFIHTYKKNTIQNFQWQLYFLQ